MFKHQEMLTHALGLNYKKIPFRNYYCAGKNPIKIWEFFVKKGYATRRDTSECSGGIYYHVSVKGLDHIIRHASVYGLDKRFKDAEKLMERIER